MKRFISCLVALVISSVAFTQRFYFIYIESEAQQPFFVKMGEKTYTSAPAGFLLLSNLKDSSYIFSIGFPNNKWPLQQFPVAINSKDRGFQLKNNGEKRWGLLDLQTLLIQTPGDTLKDKTSNSGKQSVSPFTALLSKAANDPSILETKAALAKEDNNPDKIQLTVTKDGAKSPDSNSIKKIGLPIIKDSLTDIEIKEKTMIEDQVIAKSDKNVVINPVETLKEEAIKNKENFVITLNESKPADTTQSMLNTTFNKNKEVNSFPEQTYKRSVITKKSESSTSEGFGLTFIDEISNDHKDTIRIIIPNTKSAVYRTNNQLEEQKFLEISSDDKDLSTPKKAPFKPCLSDAAESDFLKLRKRMAAQKSDDEMINESRKIFKAKCFTAEQVKNLGNLFLNEAGKYQFYEVAYPSCIDKNNFNALEMEFKDNYFIYRFKKLVN